MCVCIVEWKKNQLFLIYKLSCKKKLQLKSHEPILRIISYLSYILILYFFGFH